MPSQFEQADQKFTDIDAALDALRSLVSSEIETRKAQGAVHDAQISALDQRVTALEDTSPEPPPPPPPPPVTKRVRVGNFYSGGVPGSDSPASLHEQFANTADIALVKWDGSSAAIARRKAWGLPIAVWANSQLEGPHSEAFPGTGAILKQGSSPTLLTSYQDAGNLSDIRATGIIDAKIASLRSIWGRRQIELSSGFMLDNSSLSPIPGQEPIPGSRLWTNTPDGMTNAVWNANMAVWLRRAAAEVPATQPLLFNIGHWLSFTSSFITDRDNPDLTAAQFVNGLPANLTPALENAPGDWSGFKGLVNLRVLDAINRPVLYHHQFASADLSNQAAQDWFWGVYAACCEPGSIVAIDLSWDSFGGRDQALSRWLQEWSDGGVFDTYRDRIEALGERTSITFPALGSSGTTVTATFEHGSIVLNTRNAAGAVQADWR